MLSTGGCEDDCDYIAVAMPGLPGEPGPPGPPGNAAPVINEAPSGLRNGVNAVFTLAHTPQTGSTAVYRNGLREILGTGYTVTGTQITFSTAPLSDDVLTIDYLIGS